MCVGIWRCLAFRFEQLQHLHELAEHEDFLAFGDERFEQFEQRLGFAGNGIVADQLRMAANLAQPRERGQDMHLALVRPFSATVFITCSRLRRSSAR